MASEGFSVEVEVSAIVEAVATLIAIEDVFDTVLSGSSPTHFSSRVSSVASLLLVAAGVPADAEGYASDPLSVAAHARAADLVANAYEALSEEAKRRRRESSLILETHYAFPEEVGDA